MKIIKLNPISLLSITILLQSFSFLSIKYSSMQAGIVSFALLIVAFGFLGMRAIFWQYLLKRTELSNIYPFASLVQVLILLYAVVLFNEEISLNNVIGLIIMLSGTLFLSRK